MRALFFRACDPLRDAEALSPGVWLWELWPVPSPEVGAEICSGEAMTYV